MAGSGKGGKRCRSPTPNSPERHAADEGSEYVPGDESGDDDTDWENLLIQTLAPQEATEIAVMQKGKAKVQETGKEKGKEKVSDKAKGKEKVSEKAKGKENVKEKMTTRSKGKEKVTEKEKGKAKATRGQGRKKSIGIEIRGPNLDDSSSSETPIHTFHDDPSIDSRRRAMYLSKLCIGERNVGVKQLIKWVPNIEALLENGDLLDACNFCEQTGYGLELIREFYLRAGFLEETEGELYSFRTSVRGVDMVITPDSIATVLEMVAQTDGIDYLNSGFDAVQDWKKIMDALCVPDTQSNGILIMSKDLKIEYRFLNFIVCYNVMPLVNTKIVRWDRMLYMYLLGNPEIVHTRNINLNVPFLIWKRMVKEIKTANQSDRLPFPLLIMRLLRDNEVNVRCTSYEHSLGIISETTLAKSSAQLQSEIRRSPTSHPAPSSSRRSAQPQQEVSLETISREQQRLSTELGRLSAEQARLTTEVGKLRRLIKAIFDKLGCCSADLPPPDAESD